MICVFSGCLPVVEAKIGESLHVVEQEALTITAETLSYFADEHLFIAEGNVSIRYRKAKLTADYVEFHENDGNALAIGNVLYEEGIETVSADQAEFNLNSEQGTITMGTLALDDDQYITGQEIIKTGDKTYTVKKGSFTACDSPRPAWQFRSSTARIHEGQYLQAWNTVGYIQGIPVFYVPYFIYPIKTERQSGFLIPELSHRTTSGYSISNAFYWVINRSQDTTLRHTFYEKRGHRLSLLYRYIYSDETKGELYAQYIHKDKIDLRTRKRLEWEHLQDLPYDATGRVELNLQSDNQFDKDFETELDDRSESKLSSTISLTKNFSQHSVKLLFDRVDDLRKESQDSNDQRMPELTFSSQKQQLFTTPLYIQQDSSFAYLIRSGDENTDLEFSRLDFHPTFSLPLNFLSGAFTVSPRFDYRATFYSRDATTAADRDLKAESASRQHYSAALTVTGPKFNRIFTLGKVHRTQKLKHLIEPRVSFHYEPAVDNSDLPKFDSIDQLGSSDPRRTLQYSLTQTLLSKRIKEKDWKKFQLDDDGDLFLDDLDTETTTSASLTLNQSYNFEEETYPFSDLNAALKYYPQNNYAISLSTSYDVYVNDFKSITVDFEGQLSRFVDFDLRWRRKLRIDRDAGTSEEKSQFLDIETNVTVSHRFRIDYRGRLNFKEGKRIEDSVGLTYNGQCWNIYGIYTQQLIDDERDKSFRIYLELKHLGKIFDIKG